MSLFEDLATAFRVYRQYGPAAEKALGVLQEMIDAVEPVLLKHGVDLGVLVKGATGSLDLGTVIGIQKGINSLRSKTGQSLISEDGILGDETINAVDGVGGIPGLKKSLREAQVGFF